jgi:predicted  nucleic acid-binding Zn-ribbon protein
MLPDLAGVVVPVVVSTLVLVTGAWVTRRYSGPAQQAYQSALTGRLDVLMAERDDCKKELARLRAEVDALHEKVTDLERQLRDLTAENLELRRHAPERVPHA